MAITKREQRADLDLHVGFIGNPALVAETQAAVRERLTARKAWQRLQVKRESDGRIRRRFGL
jgi:hypothetical protein